MKIIDTGSISDGYHTFDELYYHRTVLFAVICSTYKNLSWKSKRHHDPNFDMYEGHFIAGIDTPEGQYTYHCEDRYWSLFDCEEYERAPEFDGHQPDDVDRLLSLTRCGGVYQLAE